MKTTRQDDHEAEYEARERPQEEEEQEQEPPGGGAKRTPTLRRARLATSKQASTLGRHRLPPSTSKLVPSS